MKRYIAAAAVILLMSPGYSQSIMNSGFSQTLTYRSTVETTSAHKDTEPPSKLLDGRYTTAATGSLEYRGDPEIEFTFGEKTQVKQIQVVCFNLYNAKIDYISVDVSEDGQTWTSAGKVSEIPESQKAGDPGQTLNFDVGLGIKKFKVTAVRAKGSKRVFLGEVIVIRYPSVGGNFRQNPAEKPTMNGEGAVSLELI